MECYEPEAQELRELEAWFTHHPPGDGQSKRYEGIRRNARWFAIRILRHCPPGDDRDQAFRALRECVMWANAAIACGEYSPADQDTPRA